LNIGAPATGGLQLGGFLSKKPEPTTPPKSPKSSGIQLGGSISNPNQSSGLKSPNKQPGQLPQFGVKPASPLTPKRKEDEKELEKLG
jgi:hypothetical protein